ncbi:MAG: Protease HtpX [Candidatus Omnitrophica bacterium]|nr:Protease HtpX [Candidatus Omnitrophota bacterium]
MERWKYQLKTVALLVGMSALLLVIGNAIGGTNGMMMAFVMAMVMNIGSYWFSDKIVLSMHGAKELGPDHPVTRMVRELSERSGLPMPKVYGVPDQAPNAFATGRDPEHAAVAVTDGLLRVLDAREVRAVMAHELGHVQNRDILISTVAATLASAVMYIAHFAQFAAWAGGGHRDGENRGGIHPLVLLLTVILAPIATLLVQTAVSRSREYLADETGARIAGDPEGLALALEKISDPARLRRFQQEEAMPDMQPAFSHLYIVNHFSSGSMLSLFSTHPPVTERVKRLRSMTGTA